MVAKIKPYIPILSVILGYFFLLYLLSSAVSFYINIKPNKSTKYKIIKYNTTTSKGLTSIVCVRERNNKIDTVGFDYLTKYQIDSLKNLK